MTTRYLTASERRAKASAATAVARAQAHIRRQPPEDEDEELGRLYPWVTTHRARQIRLEIEADQAADDWWPTPTQEYP